MAGFESMSVTALNRSTALAMDQAAQKYVKNGVRASKLLGSQLEQIAIRMWKEGRQDLGDMDRVFAKFANLLRDAMSVTHIWAMAMLKREMPPEVQSEMLFAFTPSPSYRGAVGFAKKLANLTDKELDILAGVYSQEAVKLTKGIQHKIERRIRQTLVRLTAQGATTSTGIAALRADFKALGLTPANSYTLENIFRTQTQIAHAAGRSAAEQDPAIQEILWGYKYVTVGDTRVRPNHRLLEGVTLPKDHTFWRENTPPNGFSCRCKAIPLTRPHRLKLPPGVPAEDLIGPKGAQLLPPGADPGFRFHPGLLFQDAIKIKSRLGLVKSVSPTSLVTRSIATTAGAAILAEKQIRRDIAEVRKVREQLAGAWKRISPGGGTNAQLAAIKRLERKYAKLIAAIAITERSRV